MNSNDWLFHHVSKYRVDLKMLHSDWLTAFPPTPQEPDFFQA